MPSIPPLRRPAPRVGRVLIIDDNTELADTLCKVLLTTEFHDGHDGRRLATRVDVVTAGCGAEGLALAQTRGFDVAIVDLKLPDASGVDLIPALREASPFGEVVLITGFATMDTAIGALRSGAFAFVPKSFRPEEFISTVEQALMKARLARARDELERRYRALVELTDVLVVGLDTQNRIVLFNRKASEVAGVSADVAMGRDFLESWIPPEDRARVREALALVGSGDRPREVEAGFVDRLSPAGHSPLRARSDLPRRIRWHLSSAREERGGADLVYGIGIDITERRALEKRAADAEAMSVMATLALNLAHEIRNPLNAAVLQLQVLGRRIDKLAVEADVRALLQKKVKIVGGEIGRLNRLLTEFLELARPRSIVREPVHVGRLVNEVLDLERASAAERRVCIVRDTAPGCVALGDSAKLKQVIINLVINALEAMKEGGTLTTRVHCDGKRVHVSITDTGVGIAPEVLDSVFDPFFTTKEAGTGLGLSIVRKIVDQHDGDVRIETERSVGTRVVVSIPTCR